MANKRIQCDGVKFISVEGVAAGDNEEYLKFEISFEGGEINKVMECIRKQIDKIFTENPCKVEEISPNIIRLDFSEGANLRSLNEIRGLFDIII